MSTRPSTPVDSDDDIRNAMTQDTPTALRTSSALKRNHAAIAGDDNTGSDNEHGSGAALSPNLALPNQNVVAAAKHYAEKKRLCGDQLTELDSFLKVSLLILTVLPLPILLFFFGQGTCLTPGGQVTHEHPRFRQPA